MDTTGLPFAKPEPRIRGKAREKRQQRQTTGEIRAYVFARERNICRCCRLRPAESMHEIKPRSLGVKISRKNSVALCGDGVHGCHGFCQRLEISVGTGIYGAEAELIFTVQSAKAAEWVRIAVGEQIESLPMIQMEMAE